MVSHSVPEATSWTLRGFARAFRAVLDRGIPPGIRGIHDEKTLKQKFLEESVKLVWRKYPELLVCTPPWRDEKRGPKRRCTTHQKAAAGKGSLVEIGCEEYWTESKEWASVDAWGMRHNFDIVVKDHVPEETFVSEVKFFEGHKSPNGEIQRCLGQLVFARSKHQIVLGICGRLGQGNLGLFSDTRKVQSWLRRLNIDVVFLDVPGT